MNLKFRDKFLVSSITLTLTGLGALAAVNYALFSDSLKQAVETQALQQAHSAAHELNAWILDRSREVERWARMLEGSVIEKETVEPGAASEQGSVAAQA